MTQSPAARVPRFLSCHRLRLSVNYWGPLDLSTSTKSTGVRLSNFKPVAFPYCLPTDKEIVETKLMSQVIIYSARTRLETYGRPLTQYCSRAQVLRPLTRELKQRRQHRERKCHFKI